MQIDEVSVVARSKKQLGKEYMQHVIKKREVYSIQNQSYSVDLYSMTTINKEVSEQQGAITEISLQRHQQLEWQATSYCAKGKYKDVFTAYKDYSNQGNIIMRGSPSNATGISVSGNESMAPNVTLTDNPYVFVKGLKDADIDIYNASISAPALCDKPIVSPLSNNAFLFYQFILKENTIDGFGNTHYEIAVEPIFKQEALFRGTLIIEEGTWKVISYDLSINNNALLYFQTFQIKGDYKQQGTKLVPISRNFTYFIRHKGQFRQGNTNLYYKQFSFDIPAQSSQFWNESSVYTPTAFAIDSLEWNTLRPKPLNQEDRQFIKEKDSTQNYLKSEAYLRQQDSITNRINYTDLLLYGFEFKNSFKKRSLWIGPALFQLVPFGVGGYRHRLWSIYSKELKDGKSYSIEPILDYGFLNKDFKGELALGYDYNPMRFSKLTIRAGDIYDYINSYQSVAGTFGPSNRVRNQKVEIIHRMEVSNGLFLKTEFLHSNRLAIDNIQYPAWVSNFGKFANPQPFQNYTVSILGLEVEFLHKQKYLIKEKQKVILGSSWPRIIVKYSLGIPTLWKSEANFGFLSILLSKNGNLRTFGDYMVQGVYGTFLHKKDLRIIEHKYFRSSDNWIFSNPSNSLQLLDTNLNTASNYLQINGIHHFNGFLLDKVFLLNRLKIEENIGFAYLHLPETNFKQIEAFIGIERKVKINKYLYKFGMVWANAISSNNTTSSRIKLSVNFYDSFRKKWSY